MATTVKFTEKSGKAAQATFPTRELAEKYARTVKNPVLVDSEVEVPPVEVVRCEFGSESRQRESTRAYFKSPGLFVSPSQAKREAAEREENLRSENEAERMAEHFAEAAIVGMSSEDAFADWEFVRRRRAG